MRALARWLGLADMPKKKRAQALNPFCALDETTEITRWDDQRTMEAVFTVRRGANEATARMPLDALIGTTNAEAAAPALTIATIQDTVRQLEHTAPPPEIYLTREESEQAARMGIPLEAWARHKRALIDEGLILERPPMGLLMGGAPPMPPPPLGNLGGPPFRYLPLVRIPGWDDGRVPRIDPETAARSRERARGLLKSLLTPEQWAAFEQGGAVTERIDGCEFTLRAGGMIQAKKPRLRGYVNEMWCVYPDPFADKNDFMPDEDKLIGQLLHLRAGPEQLRARANIFPG